MNTHLDKTILTVLWMLFVLMSPAGYAQEDDAKADVGEETEEFQLVEYPIAILPFRERGKEVKEMGGQVADLMFAKLVVDPSLNLVDREDLKKTLEEAELNLSGAVNPKEAIAIGQLTGATADCHRVGLSNQQHDLPGCQDHRHRNESSHWGIGERRRGRRTGWTCRPPGRGNHPENQGALGFLGGQAD